MTPLERRADRLFSRFIRDRDRRCLLADASCRYDLECAHLFSRRFKAIRWEPLNAVALCTYHHRYMTEHPLAWSAWMLEHLGRDEYRALLWRAYNGARPDVQLIVEDLKRRMAA